MPTAPHPRNFPPTPLNRGGGITFNVLRKHEILHPQRHSIAAVASHLTFDRKNKNMRAVVQKVNLGLPYCDAKTDNDILVVFRPPIDIPPRIGDVLDVDLLTLDTEQKINNETKGTSHRIIIRSTDIHDLRIPASHGTSRFPSVERRLEIARKEVEQDIAPSDR